MEGEQARVFIMTITSAFVWIVETTMEKKMVGEMVNWRTKEKTKVRQS